MYLNVAMNAISEIRAVSDNMTCLQNVICRHFFKIFDSEKHFNSSEVAYGYTFEISLHDKQLCDSTKFYI